VERDLDREDLGTMKKIVLITGASSGIGLACARHLSCTDNVVVGTSRRPDAARERLGETPFPLIGMDTSDEASVNAGVAKILSEHGRVDVLINNAGYGIAGSVEDTSTDEARRILETNVLGPLRVCRAVLPTMRVRRAGLIVNVSSLAGRIGLPFQGLYSATKFALEGLTEALRMEVKPFGVRVVLIEPGDFRTPFTDHRLRVNGSSDDPTYGERFRRALTVAEHDERNGADPSIIARLVERLIEVRHPRVRYPVGAVFQRLAGALKAVLPSRVFEWALMKYYHV
jgi:NAD(P)-dependent dehydrogenase (short-subunit alcohol dehydrogenase family)